jgi:hypothetical protein
MRQRAPDGLDRTIFDAVPIPAFIVNHDVEILDLNDSAEQFCGQTLNMVFRRRGGDVLGCLHSTEDAEGCGRAPACQGCIIRNSVKQCLEGQSVCHRLVNLQVSQGLKVADVQALVTASPLPDSEEPEALLILEQIPGLAEMRAVVPICMHCKKVWDEEHYWMEVDEYLHERAGYLFARGICPSCANQFTSKRTEGSSPTRQPG